MIPLAGALERGLVLDRILTDWTARLVRLRWLVGLVIVVLGMAGPGVFRGPVPPDGMTVLGLVILLYNLLFQVSLWMGGADRPGLFATHRRLAFWQVTTDWIALIAVLFLTGGPFNPIAIIFVFHVVLVAVYLPPRETLISGAVATTVLAAGTVLHLAGHSLPKSALWGGLAPSPGTVPTVAFILSLVFCYSVTAAIIHRLGNRVIRDERDLRTATHSLEIWRDRARTLNQMSIDINLARDVDSIFRKTVQAATVVCNTPAAGIRIYDEKTGLLELVSSLGLSPDYLRKGPVRLVDSPVDQRALSGEVVAVPNLRHDPIFQYPTAAEGEGIVSVLCAPLEAGGHFFGVLRAYDRRPRVFGPTAREFIAGLASLAASALANARAYEALEVRDRMTRDFVVSATHSLRSPLAATQNLLDVLLEGYSDPVTEPQRKILGRIRRKNEHLLTLVRELLYLTSRDLDSARGASAPLDLSEVVRAETEKAAETAEEAGVELRTGIGEGDFTLEGGAEELGHLVANLVGNGIKYTPRGGRVTVSLEARENGLHLLVEDTGIGIPPDEQPMIFDSFFRATNARDLTDVGTGLGLTLVKRVVERMGGQVTLSSAPGEGTAVHVWLPRRAGHGTRVPVEPEPVEPEPADGG